MARDFERGSSHRIASGSTGWGAIQACTFAAVCTVESIPAAANYHYLVALSSGTTARQMAMLLNGDSSGTLAFQTGTTRANPGTNIVPPTDTWVLLAVTKAAGTVTPTYYMYRFDTGAFTIDTAGGTIANRTAAVVTMNYSGLGSASYWDGQIAIGGMWPVVLTSQQILNLARSPRAWYDNTLVGAASTFAANSSVMDLRWTIDRPRDIRNPTIAFTGGTDPGLSALPSATVPIGPWS